MTSFFIRFWPVLIPILTYCVWFFIFRKKKDDEEISEREEKLWIWTLITSIVIAIICVISVAMNTQSNAGSKYVPAQYKDGKLIPARVVGEE